MATRRHRDVNTFGDLSYLSECRFESMMRCQGAKRRAIGRSPLPLVVMGRFPEVVVYRTWSFLCVFYDYFHIWLRVEQARARAVVRALNDVVNRRRCRGRATKMIHDGTRVVVLDFVPIGCRRQRARGGGVEIGDSDGARSLGVFDTTAQHRHGFQRPTRVQSRRRRAHVAHDAVNVRPRARVGF